MSNNRLAGAKPLDQSCGEPLVAFDLEPSSADVLDGAAQEMLPQ
ncbi:MAG: hypothetical protein ACRDSI_02645 [Pseudonocardiaceae bacterium]